MSNVRQIRKPAKFPKTAPAITEDGIEFTACHCEECDNDTFYIGIFDGQFKFQCTKCYPTTERKVH